MPESPATPEAFFLVMRDNYQGTEFDLSKGLAAGPFGVVDRYTGVDKVFERPIGIYRQAYSYITEIAKGSPVVWWGPHASVTTVYRPVPVAVDAPPDCESRGWYKSLDRGSSYWAHRYIKQIALMRWSTCMEVIGERQAKWEAKGRALVAAGAVMSATARGGALVLKEIRGSLLLVHFGAARSSHPNLCTGGAVNSALGRS